MSDVFITLRSLSSAVRRASRALQLHPRVPCDRRCAFVILFSTAAPRFKAEAFTLYATHLDNNLCNHT